MSRAIGACWLKLGSLFNGPEESIFDKVCPGTGCKFQIAVVSLFTIGVIADRGTVVADVMTHKLQWTTGRQRELVSRSTRALNFHSCLLT